MSKIADFFLGFKKRYDEQVIRNQKMDEFLSGARESCSKMDGITTAVKGLTKDVEKLNDKVDNLQEQMTNMGDRLEVIGRGTKIELLETLYRWWKILNERKWRTKEETKEIEELYEIYNKKLKGNGQGTAYYNDIMALPLKEITNETKI